MLSIKAMLPIVVDAMRLSHEHVYGKFFALKMLDVQMNTQMHRATRDNSHVST